MKITIRKPFLFKGGVVAIGQTVETTDPHASDLIKKGYAVEAGAPTKAETAKQDAKAEPEKDEGQGDKQDAKPASKDEPTKPPAKK